MKRYSALLLALLLCTATACNSPSNGTDPDTIPLDKPQAGSGLDGSLVPPTGQPHGDPEIVNEQPVTDDAQTDETTIDPPPTGNDADTDGIVDAADNCPQQYNPSQLNLAQHPTLGDRCNTAIVWVSTVGANTLDGSYLNPVATLEKAKALATQEGKSGHIFLREGTYAGPVTFSGGITLIGGFFEEKGDLQHDAVAHVATITHKQNAPVILVEAPQTTDGMPTTIRDVRIQQTHAELAQGIRVKGVSTTIRNVVFEIASPKASYGVWFDPGDNTALTLHLEANQLQLNPQQAGETATGVVIYNAANPQQHTTRLIDNRIAVAATALAVGVQGLESTPLGEFWLWRNRVIVTGDSVNAVGVALGWATSLSDKFPVDAVAGDHVALLQNQITVTAKKQAHGIFLRGSHDLQIANNAVRVAASVNTADLIGLAAHHIEHDAIVLGNTIRLFGDAAIAVRLQEITNAGDVGLINNLLDLRSVGVTRTAFSLDNVEEIALMTHNLVTSNGKITYLAQWHPKETDAGAPAQLELQVANGSVPIKQFVAADNPLVKNAKFLDTSGPTLAADSPAKDAGFDFAAFIGPDSQSEEFQTETAVDVFNTKRPQGATWDIGAFEQ